MGLGLANPNPTTAPVAAAAAAAWGTRVEELLGAYSPARAAAAAAAAEEAEAEEALKVRVMTGLCRARIVLLHFAFRTDGGDGV